MKGIATFNEKTSTTTLCAVAVVFSVGVDGILRSDAMDFI